MCRICHEGAGGETLLSPCDCTGTLGKVHKSCLEKWLSSSNTSYCELCHTEFTIERRPQPLTQVRTFGLQQWMLRLSSVLVRMCMKLIHVHWRILRFGLAQWLKDPGPRSEKRTLLCDMACFLLITPLAAISGWLCLRGAQDHLQLKSRLEAVGLIALTIALFTIYILWTLVTNLFVTLVLLGAGIMCLLFSLPSSLPHVVLSVLESHIDSEDQCEQAQSQNTDFWSLRVMMICICSKISLKVTQSNVEGKQHEPKKETEKPPVKSKMRSSYQKKKKKKWAQLLLSDMLTYVGIQLCSTVCRCKNPTFFWSQCDIEWHSNKIRSVEMWGHE